MLGKGFLRRVAIEGPEYMHNFCWLYNILLPHLNFVLLCVGLSNEIPTKASVFVAVHITHYKTWKGFSYLYIYLVWFVVN